MVPTRGFPSRFSIRTRLTFLAGAASALVLTVGATLMYVSLTSAIDRAVTAELQVRADDLETELAQGAPIAFGGTLRTQVLDVNGHVVAPANDAPILTPAELEAVATGELLVDRDVGSRGDGRILARTVTLDTGVHRIIVVTGTTAPLREARRRLVLVLGLGGPLLVSGVALTAWLLTRAALRPVGRMTRRAATFSLDEPDARLPQPPGRDELAALGHTLNAMLRRLAATIAHERAFVDNASHELRTPLAVLRGELELLRVDLVETSGEQAVAGVDSAMEEVDRLTRLAANLLALARVDAGEIDRAAGTRVAEVVREVTTRMSATSPVGIHTDLDEAITVPLGPDGLAQIVTNLVANALRFAHHSVSIRVSHDDIGRARLEVSDDGPGFDPAIIDTAFDRFVTADAARARGGTGLGLSIVEGIVSSIGGRVQAVNDGPLGGATVAVTLPISR